jgi:fibronectin-binding autotransporter adhesin
MRRSKADQVRTALARISPFLFAMLLAGVVLGGPRAAEAQLINDSWNGSVSNLYNVAGNWSNGVPNNGTPAGTTYNVSITNTTFNTTAVTTGISPTVSGLTIGAFNNSLIIANGSVFTIVAATTPSGVGTTVSNAGLLTVGSSGSTTELVLSGANGFVTLTGGGTVSLSNSTANVITGATGSETLVNTNNTIQGAGQLGNGSLNIINQSIINGNSVSGLTINPGSGNTVTNTGTLEATLGGGLLTLEGTYANAGGLIQATSAATVNLTNATINGGTLTTTGTGVLDNTGTATLNGVTVSSGSTVTLNNGSTTTLLNTITNNGTILENSSGSTTVIDIGATGNTAVTLGGTGKLMLSNSSANEISGGVAGATLTNSAGHTIQGAGLVGSNLMLINNGTIDANVSSTLSLNASAGVSNTSTLEATAGGTLALQSTVTNTGAGTILSSGAGSTVHLGGSIIIGGTLTTTGGGVIDNNNTAQLNGVTVSSGSTVTLNNGTTTTLAGTITNNGTLLENSSGSATVLFISGTVTHTGGGSITLSNSTANQINNAGSSATLINDTSNTIQGAGAINGPGLTLTNKGTVDANVSSTLTVNNEAVTNTGTLEATAGGTLALATTITNTGGLIESLGKSGSNVTSTVLLNGATINGGTLTTDGVGTIQNNGGATLNGVTISSGSTVTLNNGSTTTLLNTITTNGTLLENSSGSTTAIVIGATGNTAATLTGTGTLTMSNTTANEIISGVAGATLTNSAGFTIQGAGQITGINLTLTNNGTIDANVSSPLTINTSAAVSNTSTLEASAGGTLNLQTTINNTGAGTILATGAGSTVNLNGATINGGTLTTTTGGVIDNNGTATLNGVTVSSGSTVTLNNGTITTLLGTITNNGTILENSTGSSTVVQIGATGNTAATLAGTGSLTMSNTTANEIVGGVAGATLANNSTIQGAGFINGPNLTLTNNGTIDANVSNALTIGTTAAVSNTNLLEATAGGILNLATTFNNTGGGTILSTGTGSTVNLSGGTINDGTLTTTSSGVIQNTGSTTLNSVTISGGSTVTLGNGSVTTLLGTITNNGTIFENSTGSTTVVQVGTLSTPNTTVTLNGTGALSLSNTTANLVQGGDTGDTLVNGAGHTIEGSGTIQSLSLTNNGTVLGNQSNALTISPGTGNSVTNNGTFQANAGGELIINAPGTFTNFNTTNGTLTGGTINVFGATSQAIFQFNNGGFANDVVTNASTILLDGASSRFWDQGGTGTNALAHFTTNALGGSFTIENGRSLTSGTASDFTNAGSLTIGETSNNVADAFTVGGSHNFVQTGGTTFLANSAATLTAPSITINGGLVEGFGTLIGNVTNAGGTVLPGDAPGTLNISGNYIQGAGGALTINIDGPTAGNGLSQLDVSGSASLAGTLNISVNPGFLSSIVNGQMFEILTATSPVTGTFGTLNGLQQGDVTFTVAYNPLVGGVVQDGVFLDAMVGVSPIPEPASVVMFGLGLAGLSVFPIRRALARHFGNHPA